MENGDVTNVRKIKNRKPVEEYLKVQWRFKHLFTMDGKNEGIKKVQAIADWNAKHSSLFLSDHLAIARFLRSFGSFSMA